MLNTPLLLGLALTCFVNTLDDSIQQSDTVDLKFRIGRGQASTGRQWAVSNMTKWFNTNYHYIALELSADLLVSKNDINSDVNSDSLLNQFNEAQTITDNRQAVLLGAMTCLYLSVIARCI